ncbi:MAG: hypothetical protein LDL41_02225 [Coleofasciculus sp. S288]|nr:hypothetical protein [Coleofasciculus sp. S288]
MDDWSLIPNNTSPARQRMWARVQSVLVPNKEGNMTSQQLQQPEDWKHSWVIVRLLSDLQQLMKAKHGVVKCRTQVLQ